MIDMGSMGTYPVDWTGTFQINWNPPPNVNGQIPTNIGQFTQLTYLSIVNIFLKKYFKKSSKFDFVCGKLCVFSKF